jgi:acetylornithine deacetylase
MMGQPVPLRADAFTIDEARLVATLVDLIAIPSVNPFGEPVSRPDQGEVRAAGYVADRLRRLGWAARIDEFAPGRANVICERPSGAPERRAGLMFAGHLDTVQVDGYDRPFDAQVRDGKVHGRGACDMKAAIACYIEVAEILSQAGVELAGPLMIAGVADEEFCQQGAKALHASLPDLELVVIGEPTELRICTAAKGLAAYTLTVEGQATHGSVPGAGRNAILRTGELLGAFVRHADTLAEAPHPLLGPGVINVGTIEGGLKPNIVPSCCRVGLSRRLLPGETAESAHARLADEIGADAGEARDWDLSPAWWTVEPYENARQDVVSGFRAAASVAGLPDTRITGFPASSDAAYFGPPVVICGPGSLDQAHSLDEWVSIEEMVTATRTYLQLVLDRLASRE